MSNEMLRSRSCRRRRSRTPYSAQDLGKRTSAHVRLLDTSKPSGWPWVTRCLLSALCFYVFCCRLPLASCLERSIIIEPVDCGQASIMQHELNLETDECFVSIVQLVYKSIIKYLLKYIYRI